MIGSLSCDGNAHSLSDLVTAAVVDGDRGAAWAVEIEVEAADESENELDNSPPREGDVIFQSWVGSDVEMWKRLAAAAVVGDSSRRDDGGSSCRRIRTSLLRRFLSYQFHS